MNPDETLLSGTPAGGGGVADIDERVLAEAVRRGLITPSQGSAAREEARSRGESLLGVLVRKGLVAEAAARDLDEETKEEFVPGYRVLSKLGEGGMGVVYRALQKRLDREVALKVVMPRLASDPSYLKRFEREAKAVAKLNHPAIVAAYDYGESNGRVFLAMEFVEGLNLADWIRKNGPMPPDRALAVARDVAAGLAHACAAGIIHRDIKPGNILLAKDRAGETSGTTASGAKVTDLGLARMGNQPGGTELTAAGSVLGTPGFMPPEQAFGEAVDHRADIYALGATLYQVLTGLRPFEAPTPVAVITRQQVDRLADPRDVVPATPAGVAVLLQGMLSRNAATRYPGWKEVLADMDAVRAGRMPALPLPPEGDRSIADPGVAAPSSAVPPTMMAPTLSTPSLPRPAPTPPPVPPAPAPAPAPAPRKPPVAAIAIALAVVGVAAFFALRPGKEPSGDPAPPPAPGPAPVAEEKEVSDDLPAAEAKARFSRIAKGRRPEALAKARKAMEVRIEGLVRKGRYGEALDFVRHVRSEMGKAAPERLGELESLLEAGQAAEAARDRNDALGVLAATDPVAARIAAVPELEGLVRLRAWADTEAPEVRIDSDPKGAMLLVGGDKRGPTPVTFRAKVGTEIPIRLQLEGYEPEVRTIWVKTDTPPVFTFPLRPARSPDPEPAVSLVPDGDPSPLWTGTGLREWSVGSGQWGLSDPSRKAILEGEEKAEPAAVLRGASNGLGFARLDLAKFVKGAAGWRLEWQMIGAGRTGGNAALVEMQFAVLGTGSALALGLDEQAAYLGARDGASKALTRSHWTKDAEANRPHTFAVECHGDVFLAFVDGKRIGSVACPKDLPESLTIRAAVEGGAGFFSDMTVQRLRRP